MNAGPQRGWAYMLQPNFLLFDLSELFRNNCTHFIGQFYRKISISEFIYFPRLDNWSKSQS
ncbi:hypothetical protein T4D_15497 [Trichinella pseudospiralis]|uniref:Uncharacterized protein n=1 Tax=Trichinella pseudospiralis TaxID=6337 RepID=A0A0V1F354_TRIPS|nr:hypothetical protein T4D_15497 [Trichinella pseudospiralis]